MSLFANNYSFTHSGDKNALEKLAEQYPYFSHVHFLLLKQLNDSDTNYNDVAAKTALHFANPFLLQQQLKQDAPTEDIDIVHAVSPDITRDITEETISIVSEETDNVAAEPIPEEAGNIVESANIEEAANNIPESQISPKPETVAKEETLLFEPLHTTDYFASQGIKLSEAVLPTDKMGRQLKSFTEWLKTMKKVHPSGIEQKIADAPLDHTVQNMAEKSNIEEEVITESMAEVYLQQGKKQKAREIYEKLSLLNPSKNAYFAAKLNEIQ